MNFNILLGLSVIVCLIGLFIRFSTWFSQGIAPSGSPAFSESRVGAAIKGVVSTLLGPRIFLVIKSFFADLLFLKRTFDKSYLRWVAHILIFTGFILLLLMHALGAIVSDSLFANYQPTLNPFLFLRNLFGVMVLAGLALAIYRRFSSKPQRLRNYPGDWAALVIIAAIILSGFFLEGTKMSSYSTFTRMTEEYGSLDEEETLALEAYWVAQNGLVSPNFAESPSAELVAAGKEQNGYNCIDCHASNRSAFGGFAATKVVGGFFSSVGDAAAVSFFYYLHILACFTLLAWLPFGKMFHIVAAPLSLLTKRVTNDTVSSPANGLNTQMLGLSACTHCGACTVECSSSMFYEYFDNDFILPSEKVQYLKNLAAGRPIDRQTLKRLQEGLYICTSCDRCTTVCPSGINLKELFVRSRYVLLENGKPETALLSHFSFPLALAGNFVDDHLKALKKVTDQFKDCFKSLADFSGPLNLGQTGSGNNESYRGCYSCRRCTNICPVVRSFDNPSEELGLLPHQIIYSLGIGNRELAMGSKMIWSCSTCYLCQEHCPNEVQLCDIFYGLKNDAINKLEAGASV
ncbi:4Fe-4S dicluster domain-containing protein [Desulforhopalus singaporensis]|uniref:Nitrate reductase gamma subunit n=1 Tax=Desulforhopalus singaporensis TaxID=91360 RepID=A0A1H0MTX2_9BACT|nr:4Fe-4S dicluster domain-containing protein [Desulforhopalus singaporensis]SDO83908.1 Nitrate reductase gamma subunit [Desulforhopalus singaporensis]